MNRIEMKSRLALSKISKADRNGKKETPFDKWWESTGKFFDPDTSDVPWFDKRKDLAEYAFRAGWQSAND